MDNENIDRNNLQKSYMYDKIAEIIDIKIDKKKNCKNKLKAKRKSNILMKYRISNQMLKISRNNINKVKGKKRNNQNHNINFNHFNKDNINVKNAETKNKLQPVNKSINIENKKIKINKFKKINEKKIKRIKIEVQKQRKSGILKLNKHRKKIEQVGKILIKTLQTTKCLKNKLKKLKKSQYRFINDMLHNNNSLQSKHYFKQYPGAFKAYHEGYKWQIKEWTMNPLNVIISSIKKLPMDKVIADFGCGEAWLSASVPHMVHSFDFIALNPRVKVCDIIHTPLRTASIDVVVFCLSLTGSNLADYIIEANRVLKINGILKIAELASRFENKKYFSKLLRCYGFKITWKDVSHDLFYFMDFKKKKNINMKKKKKVLPLITLKSYSYIKN